MSASYSSMTMRLGEDTRITCHAYPGELPILSIGFGGGSLLLASATREVAEAHDVESARALLAAAQTYAAEVERLYAERSEPSEISSERAA
ncbi:hypothetical protein ACFVH6_38705 [Spirillospora sp. NPDC127200]